MLSSHDLAKLHDAFTVLANGHFDEAAAAVSAVFLGQPKPADGYVRFVLDDPDQADIECAAAYIANRIDDMDAGILRYTVEWMPTNTFRPVG